MREDTIKEAGFTVLNKTIIVKPILRMRNPMVSDPEHEAYFLFGTATTEYCLPVDRNNVLMNPFKSKEEQIWLEKQLDADLNIYKKTDNFWKKHKVRLGKDERKLDLSNPKDYLDYIVLRANTLYIAPDGESQKKKATYRYALVSEEYETQTIVKGSDKKKAAYKALARLEDKGKSAMLNFLKVYGHRVSPESKIEFLTASIDKIIDEDIDGFLKIADDKQFDMKLLIADAAEMGVIVKKGKQYFLKGGDPLCGIGQVPTIETCASWLKEPSNSEVLQMLMANVNSKK